MDEPVDLVAVLRARLQEVRAVRGRSAELARRAGVDASTVSEWIAGKYFPNLDKIPHIADVLGLSVEEFFTPSMQAIASQKGSLNDLSSSSPSSVPLSNDGIADAIITLLAHLDQEARAEVLAKALTALVQEVKHHATRAARRTRSDRPSRDPDQQKRSA